MLNPIKGLLVYPDGSYGGKDGPGGWAWVAVDAYGGIDSESGFKPPPTTNNRMELYAAYKGLHRLSDKYGPCEIEVVSDSQYVVLGCQNPLRARNVNTDLWGMLDGAIRIHRYVQFRHIDGHNGVKWNERADALAVQARREAKWQPQ